MTTEIGGWLLILFLLCAAGCAVGGWVINMPDGARRYRWRFATDVCLAAGWFCGQLTQRLWSLPYFLFLAAFVFAWVTAGSAWRKWDRARQLERAQTRKSVGGFQVWS